LGTETSSMAKKGRKSFPQQFLAREILQQAFLQEAVKVDLEKAEVAHGLDGAGAVLAHLFFLELKPGG